MTKRLSIEEAGFGDPSPTASLIEGELCPELTEIVATWPQLSDEIQGAVLAIVRCAGKKAVGVQSPW